MKRTKAIERRRGAGRRQAAAWAVIAGLAGLAVSAAAQPDEPRPEHRVPYVRVTGTETVSASPDRAEIEVGVVTQSKSAERAAEENARRLSEVVSAVREAAGKNADVRTSGYSIRPDYRYGEGVAPEITGYTASNVLTVKLTQLDRVSGVIDAAMRSGANTVQSLRFTIENEAAVRAEALRGASTAARKEAEAVAAALGVRLGQVLGAEVGSADVVFPERAMMRAAAGPAPPTPIEPGTIEVRAQVTVTFAIRE